MDWLGVLTAVLIGSLYRLDRNILCKDLAMEKLLLQHSMFSWQVLELLCRSVPLIVSEMRSLLTVCGSIIIPSFTYLFPIDVVHI